MAPKERPASARLIFYPVLTVLLVGLGTFVPLLSFWGMLLSPLPLALLGCRGGVRWLGMGLALTLLLLWAALSPVTALYFLLGCAPLSAGLFLVSDAKTREYARIKQVDLTGGGALFICVLFSIAAKLSLLGGFRALTGRNILLPDAAQMELILGRFYSGLPEGAQSTALHEAVRQMSGLFPYMLPSLLVVYCGLDALLNYRLCGFLQRGSENRPPDLPAFAEWRLPKSLLPALLLALVLSYFFSADNWLQGAMFAANLRLVLNVLFFIEGVSLTFWWMRRREARPLFRVLICLAMLIPLTWLWLIFMGISDIIFDFRSRAANAKKPR